MDAYIISMLTKSAGAVLSDQAYAMERAFSSVLEDMDVVLTLEFGVVTTTEGMQQRVFLEADKHTLELYARSGPNRNVLLSYNRDGLDLSLTGGALSEDIGEE
jgi:tagatose-1,6-bisphosphate aldolase